MNWDAIGAIGEILGTLTVLVTLVYLARQVRQNTDQARLTSIQAVNASNDSAFEPICIPENRLISSFDATTYQYSKGAYDEELYWGTVKFYAAFISTPGGAEWFENGKSPFSELCIKNLESQLTT